MCRLQLPLSPLHRRHLHQGRCRPYPSWRHRRHLRHLPNCRRPLPLRLRTLTGFRGPQSALQSVALQVRSGPIRRIAVLSRVTPTGVDIIPAHRRVTIRRPRPYLIEERLPESCSRRRPAQSSVAGFAVSRERSGLISTTTGWPMDMWRTAAIFRASLPDLLPGPKPCLRRHRLELSRLRL